MNEEVLEKLLVVKRNGKKVPFDTTKVAIAIKKGFDGVAIVEDEECKYDAKDVQKIYQNVIKKIVKDYKEDEKIKSILPEILPLLPRKAKEIIEKQGTSYTDEEGDLVTSIIGNREICHR